MTDISVLEKTLNLHFQSKALLTTALTHRSFLNENPAVKESNERLEFLGDSVLQVITSTRLYHQFPKEDEGKLTSFRANLVKAKTLATAAQKLNLGQYLLMSHGEEKSGGRQNPSLLANTFEAIVGALYLDQGLGAVESFLEKHLLAHHPALVQEAESSDFKSKLQEVVQEKQHVSPSYKVLSETGPDHAKIFTVGLYIKKVLVATGSGKSKQEAEQNGAAIALGKILR